MNEQRRLCADMYRRLRENAKAPVMITFKTGESTYYVEAKDGSISTNITQQHCSRCAKGQGVFEWKKQKDEGRIGLSMFIL